MRAFLAVVGVAVLLTTGCTTKNIGDAFVTQTSCENQGDYWVDDVNGCLSEEQVIKWVGSACYCETYLACEARGFPDYGPDGSGCDPTTYEWVDGDAEITGELTKEDLPEGAVLWSEAVKLAGATGLVCGDITGANRAETSAGTPTYIDLGKRFPDKTRVSIVIWGDDLENFETDPKEEYRRGSLCVSGKVERVEGVLQIEVSGPEQLTVLR